MWVPLVENDEYDKPGADYFIRQHIDKLMAQSPRIDTLLLACTHYPLLMDKIRQFAPDGMKILSQGTIVAPSLAQYLVNHPEMAEKCTTGSRLQFYTTDSPADFDNHASRFFGQAVQSKHIDLQSFKC